MMEEESAAISSLFSFVFLLLLRIQEYMRRASNLAFEYGIVVFWMTVRHLNNRDEAAACLRLTS
jgi:hypothetical protein